MNYIDFINPSFTYAIVGATLNHDKYGWIVFDNLRRKGLKVIPVNPKYDAIDSVQCYPDLIALPQMPDVAVFVVPPEVGLKIVPQAAERGIKKIWCQPGAESEEIKEAAKKAGMSIVADGSCIMVATNYLKLKHV